jgi:hypothetical protein
MHYGRACVQDNECNPVISRCYWDDRDLEGCPEVGVHLKHPTEALEPMVSQPLCGRAHFGLIIAPVVLLVFVLKLPWVRVRWDAALQNGPGGTCRDFTIVSCEAHSLLGRSLDIWSCVWG